MTDIPQLADECKRLLDNGYSVLLFRNPHTSYTAVAVKSPDMVAAITAAVADKYVAVGHEPSDALFCLTEQVMQTGEHTPENCG